MRDDIPKLPLNEGQTLAAAGFFAFLLGDQKELCISGPGGVGKTFLMGHLIDEVMLQYFQTCEMMGVPAEYHDVIMLATTNKAAEVLGRQTGRPTETAHAFFNLKVVDDYTTGKSKCTKSNMWTVHSKMIIFIDECSMIDSDLYEYINEGTHKCKIVYVGDHCQLAPVEESLSPVYRRNLPFYELTEPMRTNIPALQALNLQMRHTVESGAFGPIQLVPGVIDHLDAEQMEQELISTFASINPGARILAYQNTRVLDYNSFIRQIRGMGDQFQSGEFLVNNSAIRIGKARLSVEDEVQLTYVAPASEKVQLAPDVYLEIHRVTLAHPDGSLLHNVPLPADRNHYTALLKYYRRMKNWKLFYHLKNTFPDLRQRDACTVYKAQGSTEDTVYIDLSDLSTCHNPAQAARLLYVAVSRARHRVAFYGELATKYGKLIQ